MTVLPASSRATLSLFVRSSVMVPEGVELLQRFVTLSFANPSRRMLLEAQFPAQLALLAVRRNDLDGARHLVRTGMDEFLRSWISLPALTAEARTAVMQPLQTLSEIQVCA